MQLKILTVTEVNSYLKKTFDNDFILNNTNIKGEISNFKLHSSGHMYFTLKDDKSKINCIMFRDNAVNLDFIPEEGMKVEIKGKISVYVKEGTFQLYCKEIKKAGIGELYEEFLKLKSQLQEEGLFDEEYKRDIPVYPKRIGVVTSPTGAAVRDIITVIRRRNKTLDIVLYPTLVQGIDAPNNIIKGIQYFNNSNSVDVIIVGRGGGSIEELWAFNDRELAYEIFNSSIPVVSAVGHEIDYTICDFASDVRAATPSAAAELVSPNINEVLGELNYYNNYLNKYISTKVFQEKNKINHLEKILKIYAPLKIIKDNNNNLNNIESRMQSLIKYKMEKEKSNISTLNQLLMTLNPLNTLGRGYSVIKDKNGDIINCIETLKKQEQIKVIMRDGSVDIDITFKS